MKNEKKSPEIAKFNIIEKIIILKLNYYYLM
jgi:hypothetical protein